MDNANTWEQSLPSQQDQDGKIIEPWWGTFNILDENIVGLPSDRPPQHDEVLSVIRMLEDAEISCCIVGEYALIYYGAGRVQNDRFLCVRDEQYDNAVALLKSRPEMMASVPPSPVQDSLMLHHLFPRFKFIGTTDFWLIMPSSFAHVSCELSGIERSLGGIPYPNLKNYVEALLDTQNSVDLEDLIDAADLSEQWGEINIDLDRDIDIGWAKQQNAKQREAHGKEMNSLCEDPRPRRLEWERSVRKKVHRLGYKLTSATHATRWRRHGSRDPRTRPRERF